MHSLSALASIQSLKELGFVNKLIRTYKNKVDDEIFYVPAGFGVNANALKLTTLNDELTNWIEKVKQQEQVEIDISELNKVTLNHLRRKVIAGSAAVSQVLEKLGIPMDWKANDTDLFLLNSGKHARGLKAGVDLVETPVATVGELLLKFDLPCCRAAIDAVSGEMWISAQCIIAIHTGRYNLPSYVRDLREFSNVVHHSIMLERARMLGGTSINLDQAFIDGKHVHKFLWTRTQERIVKYASRGFEPNFIETSQLVVGLVHRFHYAIDDAFDKLKLKLKLKEETVNKDVEVIDRLKFNGTIE